MRVRPLFKIHGGKFYLAPRIVSVLNQLPHSKYIECYGGAASVLLRKPIAANEHYNEIDCRIFAAMQSVRDHSDRLISLLQPIKYTEESFRSAAFVQDETDEKLRQMDPVDLGVAYIVRSRMSRGGLGKHFAWSNRNRGGQPGDINAWETFKLQIPAIHKRLRLVEMTNLPAMHVIFSAKKDTLIYADPPYLPKTRSVKQIYRHEMTQKQHIELLEALNKHPGPVVLSGYCSDLYTSHLNGWNQIEWDMPNNSGQNKTKNRRKEMLWIKE